MIEFEDLFLDKVVIHKIGNKLRNESYQLSKKEDRVNNEDLKMILERYFLKLFLKRDPYLFYHESDLNLNEVYHYTQKIFFNRDSFLEQSRNIVKHLYNTSSHPSIKSGDFYMAHFVNNDNSKKAIGIFKAENKDTFLKIDQEEESFSFSYDKGLSLNKIDKGCLIINDDSDQQSKVYVIDSSSKTDSIIAKYWEESFLNVKKFQDEEIQTKEVIKIVEQFSSKVLSKELSKAPKEILEFNNKAIEYLGNSEEYIENDFNQLALRTNEERNKFVEFKRDYEEKNDLDPINKFNIKQDAFDKKKTVIKSVLKFDTGVEMKITNYDYLEDGFDEEKQMKYMKVFYNKRK